MDNFRAAIIRRRRGMTSCFFRSLTRQPGWPSKKELSLFQIARTMGLIRLDSNGCMSTHFRVRERGIKYGAFYVHKFKVGSKS